MPLSKEQKKQIIEDLTEKISRQQSITLVGFAGVNFKDFSGLRQQLKAQGGDLVVAKKTLVNLALKDKYPEAAKELTDLKGEIALVFGFEDPLASMKAVYTASKTNENLKILAGLFETKLINQEEVIVLAQLPSQQELAAQLVGTLAAVLGNFTNVLQGNLRNLISIFNQVTSRNT